MIARSYLYVPANNPAMLEKAVTRGADALIIDLEDAVAVNEKQQARQNLQSWLSPLQSKVQIWVRINADSVEHDLECIDFSKVTGVVVPKATEENLKFVSSLIADDILLSALIESADSVLKAKAIAQVNKVSFLQIGQLDLRAELGLSSDTDSLTLQYALSHLVLASAAANIYQPIAPIYRDFNDESGLRRSCQQLKADGFFGRTCIHPKQVMAINEEFETSDAELLEAQKVVALLDNSAGAATDSDGRMIDEASARIARRIISRRSAQRE